MKTTLRTKFAITVMGLCALLNAVTVPQLLDNRHSFGCYLLGNVMIGTMPTVFIPVLIYSMLKHD